jgi:hypothetical protein
MKRMALMVIAVFWASAVRAEPGHFKRCLSMGGEIHQLFPRAGLELAPEEESAREAVKKAHEKAANAKGTKIAGGVALGVGVAALAFGLARTTWLDLPFVKERRDPSAGFFVFGGTGVAVGGAAMHRSGAKTLREEEAAARAHEIELSEWITSRTQQPARVVDCPPRPADIH